MEPKKECPHCAGTGKLFHEDDLGIARTRTLPCNHCFRTGEVTDYKRKKEMETREKMFQVALGETSKAYGDCNDIHEYGRNLNFKSDVPLSFEQWCEVMETSLKHYNGYAYNDFGVPAVRDGLAPYFAQLSESERESVRFFTARESSVCAYIVGPSGILKDIGRLVHADEVCFQDDDNIRETSFGPRPTLDWELSVTDPSEEKQLRLWWD